MKETEVRLIHSTLKNFLAALNRCQIVEPEIFVPIRLGLDEAANVTARWIPDARTRNRIYRVEHLNQNFMLKTESIDDICNHHDWIASRISIAR